MFQSVKLAELLGQMIDNVDLQANQDPSSAPGPVVLSRSPPTRHCHGACLIVGRGQLFNRYAHSARAS